MCIEMPMVREDELIGVLTLLATLMDSTMTIGELSKGRKASRIP